MIQKRIFGYIKIGTIPVLCGVLYFALPRSRTNSGDRVPTPNTVDATLLTGPAQDEASKKPDGSSLISNVVWPVFQTSDIGDIDPFDRRMIFPDVLSTKSSVDESNTHAPLLAGLLGPSAKNKTELPTIQAIYQSPKGIAALIGDRVIHVGDRLEDGARVISITADQLMFSSSTVD